MRFIDKIYLFIVVLSYLWVRIWIENLNPFLSGIDGYYHLSISQHIYKTGFPPKNDIMEISNNIYLYPPVIHYIIAILSVLSYYKLEFFARHIGELFGLLTVINIYIYHRKNYSSEAAIFSAFFLSIAPAFVWRTTINCLSATIAMYIFSLILCWRKNIYILFLSVVFSFLSSGETILFIPYLIFSEKKIRKTGAAILFAVIISFTYYYLQGGLSIENYIQYIPSGLKNDLFHKFTLAELLLRINIFMLIPGIIGTLKEKEIAIQTIFLILIHDLKIIEMDRSFSFLTITAAIMCGAGIYIFQKNRIFRKYLIFLIVLSLIYPYHNPLLHTHNFSGLVRWGFLTETERESYAFLRDFPNGIVISTEIEGNWIKFFSRKKVFIDGYFTGERDSEKRYNIMKQLYTTENSTVFSDILRDYNISYIVSTYWPAAKFNASYIYKHKCLRKLYTRVIKKKKPVFHGLNTSMREWNYIFDIYTTESCR